MTDSYKSLQSVTDDPTIIGEVIWKLRASGLNFKTANEIMEAVAAFYNLDKDRLLKNVEDIFSHSSYDDGEDRRFLSDRINDFIDTSHGWFDVTMCDRELHIVTSQDRANRRQVFHRLVKQDIVERHSSRNGVFRKIERDSPLIEWEEADISNVFEMNWPFELENYALMYPKNIAVISGSPDAGKTAFLLNVTRLNMDKHTIHYFSSEMGAEEMKLRLSKFENVVKWVFDPRERSINFADIIYADDINIIDYFEFASSEFYRIAEELRAIFDKLNKGIAIIALQKKRGAELGRGAEFGLEKPRLYLSMDSGVLKIIKAKNWAVEGQNPNGMEFHFSLVNGAKFIY